jgi:hypothetical protein
MTRFQPWIRSFSLTRGDALRVASRLPVAFIFRAFGALFTRGDALRFASRLPVAFIFRAFGALSLLPGGRRAPLRFALALAFIFRAFGALFRLCVQSQPAG